MEKITTQSVYLPIDVNKILPAQDKDVTWIMDNGNAYTGHMDEDCGNWWVYIYDEKGETETMSPYDFTHWLEKKEDMVCMTKADAIKWAGEIWNAGFLNGHSQGADIENFTNHPDKDTYINNLFNQ